jgi:type II secretion system protein C
VPLKKQFKPIIVLAMVSLSAVLAAGVWLLMDDGQKDFGIRAAKEAYRTESRLSGPVPSEASPQASPAEFGSSPAEPPASFPLPDPDYLHLIGVATDPIGLFAVILNRKNSHQGLFRTGDSVDGALLLRIQADQVTLRRNNRLITLMLESFSLEEEEPLTGVTPREDYPAYHLSVMEQADIETAWTETQTLMTRIELLQNTDNGTPAGFTVQKVAAGSVFDKIGLMQGDVILGVDDMEIAIMDDAMEIYNCLRTQENVRFTIKRNNETLTLDYTAALSSD